MLLGIKSRPSAFSQRQAIRKTWTNQRHWHHLKIIIKPIFLLGIERDPFGNPISLREEDLKSEDILVSNFTESHYGLVNKDYQSGCPKLYKIFFQILSNFTTSETFQCSLNILRFKVGNKLGLKVRESALFEINFHKSARPSKQNS